MGDIPGLSEDLTNQKENTARTFAFKAFRCYHLAESYVVMKKWEEAMGLLDRALEHMTQTMEQYRELKVGEEDVHKIDKVRLVYSGGELDRWTPLIWPSISAGGLGVDSINQRALIGGMAPFHG